MAEIKVTSEKWHQKCLKCKQKCKQRKYVKIIKCNYVPLEEKE